MSTASETRKRFGTWWLMPFARAPLDLVGLRLLPQTPRERCPVMQLRGPGGVTLATRPGTLVPMLVYSSMVSEPRVWARVAVLLQNEWEELESLHRALGGEDELALVRSLAGDASLRAACSAVGAPHAAYAAADGFIAIDPSDEHKSFQHWLRNAVAMRAPSLPLPDAGCWSGALASAAFSLCAVQATSTDDELLCAWGVVRRPPSIDAGARSAHPWLPEPDPTGGAKEVWRAARLLVAHAAVVSADWRADPIWRAVEALAAARSPFGFDGVEFMEAAAALDGAGQPERAYETLLAVPFWGYLSRRRAPSSALDAARWLAERNGWKQLAVRLGDMMT